MTPYLYGCLAIIGGLVLCLLVTSGNDEKILSNLVKQEIMQRDAIIERQRIIIEQFMYGRDGAYEDAENTTTMTGASEQ